MIIRPTIFATLALATLSLGITLSAGVSHAATSTTDTVLSPSDDTDVTYERSTLTNGASVRLRAGFSYGETKEAFVKFKVTTPTSDSTITRATLRLTRDNEPLPATVNLWSLKASEWNEQSLTAGTRPAQVALLKAAKPVSGATTIDFDLTSVIKTSGVYAFSLTSPVGLARFQSKEAGAQGPKLLLTMSSPVVASPTPTSPTPTASTPPPVSGDSRSSQVLTLVNTERQKVGCAPLQADSRLANSAKAHSVDMAKRNFFAHVNPDGAGPNQRMIAAGFPTRYWAENIAAGQRDPAAVMKAWMNSSGHRANILNCNLRYLGIGVTEGGSYGIYWTQNFATP